jgi:hypothetical protein
MIPATPPRSLDAGVAAALLAGATLAQGLPALPPMAASACAFLLALAASWRGSTCAACWRRRALRLGAATLLGGAWACTVAVWRLDARWPETRSGDTVRVEGRIAGPGEDDDADEPEQDPGDDGAGEAVAEEEAPVDGEPEWHHRDEDGGDARRDALLAEGDEAHAAAQEERGHDRRVPDLDG